MSRNRLRRRVRPRGWGVARFSPPSASDGPDAARRQLPGRAGLGGAGPGAAPSLAAQRPPPARRQNPPAATAFERGETKSPDCPGSRAVGEHLFFSSGRRPVSTEAAKKAGDGPRWAGRRWAGGSGGAWPLPEPPGRGAGAAGANKGAQGSSRSG
nr:translation initiation factor IF-2-like [Taeniopygia guttata]